MSALLAVGVIYKITYPNGKIYIGQDRTDDINYFGSAKSRKVAEDFPGAKRDDITIRKEVIFRQGAISICDLNKRERFFIRKFNSDDPAIGYNGRFGSIQRLRTIFLDTKGERK